MQGHANGIVAACTMSSNACTQLSANNTFTFMFVAMDKSGNCYADSIDASSGSPALWYWAGCSGSATEITTAQGFVESSFGGIDVDNAGNLVVLTLGSPSTLTVYSGCSTGTCTLVTGPTPLVGAGNNECVYGHLGRFNGFYACGDYTAGQVDVYSYGPTRIPVYKYSFNNGLSQSDVVEAASYSPESKL